MNETCVCCGEIIPEGLQVCRKCMRLASLDVVPAQIVERAGTRFLSKEDPLILELSRKQKMWTKHQKNKANC